MKVLQINSVCGQGSTGRIVVDLYSEIRKNGHECCIAYGRGKAPETIVSYRIGHDIDVYSHALFCRLTDKQGLYSTVATKSFVHWIKEYKPDIIHLHNVHGYYVNYRILFEYLAKADIPVIWTLHDCWAFTGHCAYFDYAGCDRWKNGCHICPQKHTYPKSLWTDHSSSNYQLKKQLFTSVKNMTIVTPSKWLADLVKQSYLKQYDVQVIHNGIDLNVFKPTASDFRKKQNLENQFIILGVASIWTERKGLSYFIGLSHLISSDSVIILVGLNDKQIKILPTNIIGIKKTNSVKALAELYSAADVFVNPTLEDNFPTTNLEALACGTPVITFDTGGSPECIDQSCGSVVKKGDLQGIFSVIRAMKNGTIIFDACTDAAKKYDKKDRFFEYLMMYQQNMRYMTNGTY